MANRENKPYPKHKRLALLTGSGGGQPILESTSSPAAPLMQYVIPLNPMAESSVKQIDKLPEKTRAAKQGFGNIQRIAVSVTMIVVGAVASLLALALLSNQFGNTATIGLLLFGLAGWVFVTGISHLFLRLPIAVLVGAFSAPLLVALLFVVLWVAIFATACLQNRNHQEFAANGVSQIQFAQQMDERYNDCRHYITYGTNGPLFNSVAYFGDRYELTMQVPVRIHSETSGTTIGEPKFYLNEIREISVSQSGQVSASFSGNLDFGATEWKRVYESNGDFSKIGFDIDPTGVPNFQKLTDGARPSD